MTSHTSEVRRAALEAVEDWLAQHHSQYKVADRWRLQKQGFPASSDGWTLPISKDVTLLIVVDGNFPYSHPKTAVFGLEAPDVAPHVEANQRLCTFPSHTRTDSTDPAGVVAEFVKKSLELLQDIGKGLHREDFVIDFSAYWRRSHNSQLRVHYLMDLHGKSRQTFVWSNGQFFLVGDDEQRLRQWVANWTGNENSISLTRSLFIWLPELPTPDIYPASIHDVRALVSRSETNVLSEFDGILANLTSRNPLLFAGATPSGVPAAAAIFLNVSKNPSKGGFRPGKLPAAILTSRVAINRASAFSVEEAMTRVPDEFKSLTNLSVALIGCGALGAGVARVLVQSGIANIKLFDPDSLGWENIGRHELGANYVGTNKATGMVEVLRRRLPTAVGLTAYNRDWRMCLAENPDLFTDIDLIVSTTGNWGSDAALADLQTSGEIVCPVVFGWLERNAAASHAVALKGNSPCLRCGFDNTGKAKTPATSWWHENFDPRCGAETTPFGAMELSFAQGLVAGLAMDVGAAGAEPPLWRVWTGSTASLESADGYWSGKFEAMAGKIGAGGQIFSLNWSLQGTCDEH